MSYFSKIFISSFLLILACSFLVKGEITMAKSSNETSPSQNDSLNITILYDNYIFKEGTKSDWGFACLIEGTEKIILFDTGTKSEILFHNISQLNVDIKKVQQIVISHHHRDHFGGLQAVLDKNHNISVYLLQSFPDSFQNKVIDQKTKVIVADKPVEICNNVFLTGEMGVQIKEQSLILDTSKGLVILTGCSHSGIVNIVKKAKEIINKDIYLVLGGFHLMRHSEKEIKTIINQFKELGVQKCGATHCTGEAQINLFKQEFGKNFVTMGTGKIIKIAQ
jgi:7,8-dihydropterin-6-yl-methyl-4-(beta-D-ribofuranosyl)aminobenzene 5'-phosphate synthase